MSDLPDYHLDPRFIAGVDMVRRTGSDQFQMRWDDEQEPVIWVAVSRHRVGNAPVYTAGAHVDPVRAVLQLCETLIDGGECAHCHRPSLFDMDDGPWERELSALVCVTQYDPELKTYRRDCEGDT